MDNNTINKFVFDTLSARKSILIEGIGTVVVVRKGSNISNPKKKRDFPRYELTINNASASVELKDVIGDEERYKNWFSSVCKVKGREKIIKIPNCVEIRMKSYVVKNIRCSEELDLQLNPFMTKNKSGEGVSILIICVLALLFIGAALYLIFDYSDMPSKPVEQKITIPEKVVYVPEPEELFDFDTTEISEIQVDTVKADTIPVEVAVVPSVKKTNDGVIEPIKNMSYMVIGSFRTLKEAKIDKARLLNFYQDININTTTKSNGGYINYIYSSSSYDEAMSKREEFAEKYLKIKGIWVYQFL